MKINQKILNKFNTFILVLIFAIRAITDAIFVSRGIDSNIWINSKFIMIIIGIIISILQLSIKNNKKIFTKELRSILFTSFSFLIITLIVWIVNGTFYVNAFEEIIKMIIPIIYAYLILNTLEFKDIYHAFIYILIINYIGLFLEVGINNFSDKSYSPFESNYFAGTSIALCVFFMYYRKSKLLTLASLLFVLLTFKRVSILFSLLLFVLPFFIDINGHVSSKYKKIITFLFIILTLIYYNLLLPSSAELFKSIFGKSQIDFTMYRSVFLSRLLDCGYSLKGFGTTTALLGKSMEMDLIKIFLETTIIGLAIFIYNYVKLCGSHIYLHFYVLYLMSNMLTSHSLGNYLGWALAFIIIGCINYKQNSNLTYLKLKKKESIINE